MGEESDRILKSCTADRCSCGHAEKLDGKYRYKISTESADCENERILVSSWTKLGKFPLLLNHEGNEAGKPIDLSKAIGTAQVFIRDAELIADIEVADEKVKARVDAGELRSASVGYRRLEYETTDAGTLITTKAELREVSLVNKGCNFDAARIKGQKALETMAESLKNLRESVGIWPEFIKTLLNRLESLEKRVETTLAPPKPPPVPQKPNFSTADLENAVRQGLREAIRTEVNYHAGRLDD